MIPKIIHYCWFGRGEKPKLAKKCINSWKRYCPDYEIIEWNEDNYDLSSAPLFVQQAIETKKWAFASDFIRYHVVFLLGGIYLDTDVEITKNIDCLLDNHVFFGMQHDLRPASGLGFGAEKNNSFIRELMSIYEGSSFIRPDGKLDKTACPKREFLAFDRHGYRRQNIEQTLHNGVHVYPVEYFDANIRGTPFLEKTPNTVMIHWYAASWYDDKQKRDYVKFKMKKTKRYILHLPSRIAIRILGKERWLRLKNIIIKQ